jgi:hypothetical protein
MNLFDNNADFYCRIKKHRFLIHLKEFLYSILPIDAVFLLFFLARPTGKTDVGVEILYMNQT